MQTGIVWNPIPRDSTRVAGFNHLQPTTCQEILPSAVIYPIFRHKRISVCLCPNSPHRIDEFPFINLPTSSSRSDSPPPLPLWAFQNLSPHQTHRHRRPAIPRPATPPNSTLYLVKSHSSPAEFRRPVEALPIFQRASQNLSLRGIPGLRFHAIPQPPALPTSIRHRPAKQPRHSAESRSPCGISLQHPAEVLEPNASRNPPPLIAEFHTAVLPPPLAAEFQVIFSSRQHESCSRYGILPIPPKTTTSRGTYWEFLVTACLWSTPGDPWSDHQRPRGQNRCVHTVPPRTTITPGSAPARALALPTPAQIAHLCSCPTTRDPPHPGESSPSPNPRNPAPLSQGRSLSSRVLVPCSRVRAPYLCTRVSCTCIRMLIHSLHWGLHPDPDVADPAHFYCPLVEHSDDLPRRDRPGSRPAG